MCIVTLADVAARLPTISWLWPWGLPRGYLTGLVADSGTGKSSIALDISRPIIQKGEKWPDGTEGTQHGSVLYADTESSQGILVDRAGSWNLPMDSFLMPTENPLDDFRADDPDHFKRMEDLIELERPPLVIVDSLRGAHRGNENSSEMLEIMSRLAGLARDLNVALLIVHHLRKLNMIEQKNHAKVTLDRVRGSSAIVQLCRVIWAIDQPDPGSEYKRLSVIKSNLGRFPEPLGFWITDHGVEWGEAPTEPHVETATDRAVDYLKDALRRGARDAVDLFDEADQLGISSSALKRGKSHLGVPSIKENGHWKWSLPHKGFLTS